MAASDGAALEPGRVEQWRVGQHYGIHVYQGGRPVATFHHAVDAAEAVRAVNALADAEVAGRAAGPAWEEYEGLARDLQEAQIQHTIEVEEGDCSAESLSKTLAHLQAARAALDAFVARMIARAEKSDG